MPPFESALRDELMAATRRRPRFRGERLAVGGVLIAFVVVLVWVAVAVTTVSSSPPAAADIGVSHKDGRVIVRLNDLENTAEAVERATDKVGLDIQVESAPAGPSLVGRFVGYVEDEGAEELRTVVDANGTTFLAFSLPEHWPGRVTLYLGSPAETGEAYKQASNAYDQGEPLACSGTRGRELRSITGPLQDYDVRVVRYSAQGIADPPVPLAEALTRDLANLPVTGGLALSSEKLLIDVGGKPPLETGPVQC